MLGSIELQQRRQESRRQYEERQDAKPRDALPLRNPRPFYCEIHGEGKGHTTKMCPHVIALKKKHGPVAGAKQTCVSYGASVTSMAPSATFASLDSTRFTGVEPSPGATSAPTRHAKEL